MEKAGHAVPVYLSSFINRPLKTSIPTKYNFFTDLNNPKDVFKGIKV
jgi:hypothetical protein